MDIDDKLSVYKELLLKWQSAVNLISANTVNAIDDRHFEDSRQLLRYIPDHITNTCDIGSGAGFPGLIIAMHRPDIEVTLIESDSKKCSFLKTVSRETNTPIHIVNNRIETAIEEQTPQLITARALASVSDILGLCSPLLSIKNAPTFLLLKGKNAQAEIEDALKIYDFNYQAFPSTTNPDGSIVWIDIKK